MLSNAITALGGVGMFLLGMLWLTEGLRGLAGRALRSALARFTRTPFSGAVTGAVSTAIIQSSSATTVTAVGFVSAGLLTFPQALGIIFGANIGTTITGWLVAILGFKLDLGQITLPLIFVGALLRMFGGPRFSLIGTALSGFSLLFIGIEIMKDGMAGFAGIVTPAQFPGDSLVGRLKLVVIGVLITVVTQSSSAGVATALAALGAGAINLPQAAAMVIGMDVGTTVTAALATLGGSTAARRTGLSHVIYNVLTGFMAFALLGPFTALVAPLAEPGEGQVVLVAFHSGFNFLGVVLVLPFAGPFARLVERLVPERGPWLSRYLDKRLLEDPDAAVDAASATVAEIFQAQCRFLETHMSATAPRGNDRTTLRSSAAAIAELRGFVAAIPPGPPESPRARRMASALHALDHEGRLQARCMQENRIATLATDARLRRLRALLGALAREVASNGDGAVLERRLNRLRRILRRKRSAYRRHILDCASTGDVDGEVAVARLDAVRWLHRVSYHLWRVQHHLNRVDRASKAVSHRLEMAVEMLED